MSLTPAQLAALRAHIDSVGAWAAMPNDSESALIIAAALNEPASPEFVVWRTQLFQDTITQNERAGIVECWSGTTARVAVQTAVLGHCKRPATVAEKVLSTGAGTTAAPALMGFEGSVSFADVQSARSL